jgi:hypothetical protein
MSPARACLSALALLLGACTVPQAEVTPEGTLEVFGPATLGSDAKLPADWVLDSESDEAIHAERAIAIATPANGAMLTLRTMRNRYILARRTKATLLATPYMGWSWRMTAASGHEQDIRLIVAFHGGNPESRSWGGEPFAYLGLKLPPFDRVIALVWGRSALERGSLALQGGIPEYVARGGQEHMDDWWSDNIDLAALYRKAWPNDRIERARIMFVGFAVAAGSGEASSSFGDIVLYR